MSYDSTEDTNKHINNVRHKLLLFVRDLMDRALKHDASKLQEPEKSVYDEFTPRLRDLKYGSDEYKQCLKDMDAGVEHHWANNDHHPEYWANKQVDDMPLPAIMEMLADWKAASERHATGDIRKSIEYNAERFHMDSQLKNILLNTVEYMGW